MYFIPNVRAACIFINKRQFMLFMYNELRKVSKLFLLQAWAGPWGPMRLRLPEFLDGRHIKVVRFSALRTGRFYP